MVGGDDWWPNPLKALLGRYADGKPQLGFGVDGANQNNFSVFVYPVEIVQSPKDFVSGLSVPSLVGLELFDSLDSFRANTLEASGDRVFESVKIVIYRELVGLGRLVSIRDNQCPDEMIQRGSQIVDRVAHDRGELVGQRLNHPDLERYFSTLGVHIAKEAVWLAPAPGISFMPEIGDVVFRPLEFYSGAMQSFAITIRHDEHQIT